MTGSPGGRVAVGRRMKHIPVGALIEAELRRQEHSVSWLARHLSCDRRNVYRIFQKESLDTSLLLRISRILDHDFFADLSGAVAAVETKTDTQP